MPRPIRVLAVDMPQMLRDIVRDAVATQRDMQLVPNRPTAPRRKPRQTPDVVVIAIDDINDATVVNRWLRRWPSARVLAVETSGRHSVMYELRPSATSLGELSREQLIDAIRRRGLPRDADFS